MKPICKGLALPWALDRSAARICKALVVILLAALLWACGGQHKPSGPALQLPAACLWAAGHPTLERATVDESRTVPRLWNDQVLESIRRDFPRPTVHARNLFHVSAAVYDAWAAYDEHSAGYLYTDKVQGDRSARARDITMSFAAFHLQMHRTGLSFDRVRSQHRLFRQMQALGLEPCYIDTEAQGPAALGNRLAALYIAHGRQDGANEGKSDAHAYRDTSGWRSANGYLRVSAPFDRLAHPFPDQFQLLEMAEATTQNGIATSNVQSYVTPHWGQVRPFALVRPANGRPYHDPGQLPAWNSTAMQTYLLDVIGKTAQLDPDPARESLINISPSVMGNRPLGDNTSRGHALNPVTGQAYPARIEISRSLWGRMLADYWADGPDSETPPGHWNLLANQVADDPGFARRFAQEDRTEWEVKTYFMLNAALHDTAIAAWEIKRLYQSARPISLIRHRASLGQNSDASAPAYHPDGLPLVPDLIELVTEESLMGRHAMAGAQPGQLVIRSQVTPQFGPFFMLPRLDWQAGELWSPYQPVNFVSPAFPGLVSGHSAFSHAAAQVLAERTGSRFFPGGWREFTVDKLRALEVRAHDDTLQDPLTPEPPPRFGLATFADAADLAGLSRLWGGIHLEPDDLLGRRLGHAIGLQTIREASALWAPASPSAASAR